jgi:hypothetical protein
MFFANLCKVYDKHNVQCQEIYNVDETAVTTVQKHLVLSWRRQESVCFTFRSFIIRIQQI